MRTDGALALNDWLRLAFLSLLWGAAFLFIGIALRDLPPMTVVLGRLGLAAVILVPCVAALGLAWPGRPSAWLPFLGMGLFNNIVPFTLIAFGQQEVASGLTSVIIATTPLWTVLLSRVFLPGERISALRLAGILFGVAGVGVLFGPEALAGRSMTLFGMLLILAAAISYGCAGVWGMRLRAVPPVLSACCQLLCSTLVVLPICLVVDQPWRLAMPGPATIGAVFGLAVLSTAIAYVVFYRVMATSGGTNAMLVTLLMPAVAILLGILVLDETFSSRHVVGAAMIGTALLLIDGRLPRAVWDRLRLA